MTRRVPCSQEGCSKEIVFVVNLLTGRSVPCDAETVQEGDQHFDPKKHKSHFLSCSNPNRFSKARRS